MNFSFVTSVKSRQALPCRRDDFYNLIQSPRVMELVKAYRDGDEKAKGLLPAFLFHATFEGNQRGDQYAHPSGLYMLDFDHLTEAPERVWGQMLGVLTSQGYNYGNLGIMLVHVTPSGKGLRVVAMMKPGHEELTTIAQWQQWLYTKLTCGEELPLDTCVKDWARLSFCVPHCEFIYMDDALFSKEAEVALDNPLYDPKPKEEAQPPFVAKAPTPSADADTKPHTSGALADPAGTAAPSGEAPAVDAAMQEFRYNGHLLSEIADAWLVARGEPKVGERHTFYYEMAKYFRFICDNHADALFLQLPDLGLGAEERRKICDHTVKMKNASRIPYDFYTFLIDNGYRERTVRKSREESVESNEEGNEDFSLFPSPCSLPKLPPLIREFVDIAPKDFKVPMIFALFPVLGTLCTRLRADYMDGEEHSPSATTVIYAPQSSGKSFVRRIDRALLGDLRQRDEQSRIKDRLYKEELQIKKNAKELPKNPHAPYRILPAVISVPQLLERQTDAAGLHQFTLLEELDTLTKSNKGGSWADKSDLYRVAYDNGEYGQDYKNTGTFSGTVRLYYNLLMCGTPKQVHRFFNDAENGLVSRVCFCEIKNQMFADLPIWKPFNQKQQEVIDKIVKRLDGMTYMEGDVIRGITTVDMSWLFKPLHGWLREKLAESTETLSGGMAHFRKRAAVNAFRYAMVCTQMYTQLRDPQKKLITDFALWFAEQDLQNRLALFEQELTLDDDEESGKRLPQHKLFKRLKEEFTREDVRVEAMRLGVKSQVAYIVHIWVKAGLIEESDMGYRKTSGK